ncbi:MAG: FMN-binding protein [Acidobacteria bacterium]|nr:FMN-binding protein [Acidobacteriota bacterium]
MKHVSLIVVLVMAAVSVGWAADRIFTNPKPDAHLKKLFPNAVAFSPLQGTPLHFKAYGVDPKTNPNAPVIGYAFWTTDVTPEERGYHAPIHFLVGLDLAGIITGVVLDYDSEPYGYFSIQPPEFVAQFKGKSVRAPFRLGQDVDAVSRATITMSSAVRAIRDSSRGMAKAFLNPASVKP